MSTLAIVIIVVAALVIVLVVGGYLAVTRRARADAAALRRDLEEADQALALARAQDRGWDRDAMEAVVREAFAARGQPEPAELMLIKVIDLPGTEHDAAVFRAITDRGAQDVRLVRTGEGWVAE